MFHIACAAVLVPVASHPYDLAVLTGNAEAFLRWGFSPFYNWKFGLDYAGLSLLAESLRAMLTSIGVPGVTALHIAWKLPLVIADVVSALIIYRLATKLAPTRAAILGALWLFNPVVLWVSAGHGQIESLALACVFGALLLALNRRFFWSGLVTGAGAGFEYFPLAVAVTVLLWWRGRQLPDRRSLVSYGGGLATSLAGCFAPLLIDPVGRQSLFGGLQSTAGFGPTVSRSIVSAWSWFGSGSAFWPLFFVGAGLCCLALVWHFTSRGPNDGLVFLSIALVLAVVLDPNSLPQFALIAAGALWLLALVVPIAPWVLVALPTAGLATTFLYVSNGSGSANAYLFDIWAGTQAILWPVPQLPRLALTLGHVFSLGLVALIAYVSVRRTRVSPRGWIGAITIGAVLSSSLVIWAGQPTILQAALSGDPAGDLPDFDAYVATRNGSYRVTGPASVEVTYRSALFQAAGASRPQPTTAIKIASRPLFSQESATTARTVGGWRVHSATIPDWSNLKSSVKTLWVELLMGSSTWTRTTPPTPSDIYLQVGGLSFESASAQVTTPGWAVVSFEVPATAVDAKGAIDLRPGPADLKWNGSRSSPWIRILPDTGTVKAALASRPYEATFVLDKQGIGYVSGLPLTTDAQVTLIDPVFDSSEVVGAVVRWTDSGRDWKSDILIRIAGATYGALLVLGAVLLVFVQGPRQLRLDWLRRIRSSTIIRSRADKLHRHSDPYVADSRAIVRGGKKP